MTLLAVSLLAALVQGDGFSSVTTVAPRELTGPETDVLRTKAKTAQKVAVEALGEFRFFTREKRRFAIWEGFLLEKRYGDTERILRALAERWRGSEAISFDDVPGLAEWIAPRIPATLGLSSAGGMRVLPRSGAILENKGRRIGFWAYDTPKMEKENWPRQIQRQTVDRTSIQTLPATTVVQTWAYNSIEEFGTRSRLAGEILSEWHIARTKALKEGAQAFFRKVQENVLAPFGGDSPAGRPFMNLQPEGRTILSSTFLGQFKLNGFETTDDAMAWLESSKVASFRTEVSFAVPVYGESDFVVTIFPLELP